MTIEWANNLWPWVPRDFESLWKKDLLVSEAWGRRFKVIKRYFIIGRNLRSEEWSEFSVILLLNENVLVSRMKGMRSLDVLGRTPSLLCGKLSALGR